MDYETKATSLHASGEIVPEGRPWRVSIAGTLTFTEGSIDAPDVELPEETVAIADYDFSAIPEYSRLKYRQIELTSRVSRSFSRDASGYVELGWYDLRDDSPWVYGDETGSVLVTRAGVQTSF
ncbi:MAG: hypothetical protein R3B81_16620 [bacterium]